MLKTKVEAPLSTLTLRTEITSDNRYFNSIVLHPSHSAAFPNGSLALCRLDPRPKPADLDFTDFLALKSSKAAPKQPTALEFYL
jgi:hypothetical protein